MVVPSVVESGSKDHVILDCDYDYATGEANQLDVKWWVYCTQTLKRDGANQISKYQWFSDQINDDDILALALKYG